MNIVELRKIALAFRKSFESADLRQAPGNLPYFPDGCCTCASLFIATFLRDKYGLNFKRIDSGHRNGSPHEWIEIDGIIVDITADQYKDSSSAVIVKEKSSWHSNFKGCQISDKYLSLYEYAKIPGNEPARLCF